MFEASTYIERRRQLRERIGSGVILFVGNDLTPMNYADNPYPFWQDRSFLYYWGLDEPGLAGLLDADSGEAILFAPAVLMIGRAKCRRHGGASVC